jgi:type II secretory pathway pseudopilin PulG
MPEQRGLQLIELLVVVALIGLTCAAVLPSIAELRTAGRGAAAAREMALTFQALRWKSVTQNRNHGLLFTVQDGGWVWFEVADGNGNGLSSAEIRRGVDLTLSGPHRLEARVSGVHLGFPPGGAVPRIPPKRGTIDDLTDPVRFGRSDLISFSPLGSASSGTLYLTDGRSGLFGVVLFGPTARVRVWRFDRRTGRWTL